LSLDWKWFIEYQTPHSAHMHGISGIVYSRKTDYQQIDIFDSHEYGRMLVLDGKVQSTTRDEYVYHESLVHPVMLAHPEPKSVLIVGGGEGGTLREVLKHSTVGHAVMVDIDEFVIESSKKYMPQLSEGSFDDKRSELVIGDGREYVERSKGKFDVIIMDLTDPLEEGPAQRLYTREFYQAVCRILNPEGMIVTQATSTYYSIYCFATIYRTIRDAFGRAGGYHSWIPAYDSTWGFVYGTKGPDPAALKPGEIGKRLAARGIKDLKYYDGAMHSTLFALPKPVRCSLEEEGSVATDGSPIFMPI
jgi:spermidine synthase